MIVWLATIGVFNFLPDNIYLKIMYWGSVGKRLHLEDPVTFTEKIQWLKLHDRKEIYKTLVDKILVKKYVSSIIGDEYIIPTLGMWDCFEEIDFDTLPNSFVLKCNHDSGSVIICKDKNVFDYNEAKNILKKKLNTNLFYWGREWPYKNVDRKILAEKYLEDTDHSDLVDYKFFCFNGVPEYCQVITNRTTDEKIDFYDMNWRHQPFVGLTYKVQNSPQPNLCPSSFEKMKEYAKLLCQRMPFCRVDFYEVSGKLYFGEITLYPASGFGWFRPDEWNTILGDKIKIE